MIVYLAGTNKKQIESLQSPISVLESFAYMKKHADTIDLLLANNFILDSGAFTFIGQNLKYHIQNILNKSLYVFSCCIVPILGIIA